MKQSGRTCSVSPKSATQIQPTELWIVEHFPVYTLGLNGKREHLLNTGNIPVINLTEADKSLITAPGN